jgi:hypothetical protein
LRKGIAKLYEQTGQLGGKYAEALEKLMKLLAASYALVLSVFLFRELTCRVGSDDATKCAESLQKYIELRRREAVKLLVRSFPVLWLFG